MVGAQGARLLIVNKFREVDFIYQYFESLVFFLFLLREKYCLTDIEYTLVFFKLY